MYIGVDKLVYGQLDSINQIVDHPNHNFDISLAFGNWQLYLQIMQFFTLAIMYANVIHICN